MRCRQGVYYNPSPQCSLSLSPLAHKRFIFSSLITWQQLMILSRNLQDMITGVPLDDLSTSLHFFFPYYLATTDDLTWSNLTSPQSNQGLCTEPHQSNYEERILPPSPPLGY